MDCWYSRYSGVTALLLATTSEAPTKPKTVMAAGERARRRTTRGGAGGDDPPASLCITASLSNMLCFSRSRGSLKADEQNLLRAPGPVYAPREPSIFSIGIGPLSIKTL